MIRIPHDTEKELGSGHPGETSFLSSGEEEGWNTPCLPSGGFAKSREEAAADLEVVPSMSGTFSDVASLGITSRARRRPAPLGLCFGAGMWMHGGCAVAKGVILPADANGMIFSSH